nr:hypothetical protein [Rhodococcus sp. 06-1059B-a]
MPAYLQIDQELSHKTRQRVIRSLPAVAAVTIASLAVGAPAHAAPSQPGVTTPQGSQPGVTTTPAPVTPPPAPAPAEPDYLPGYTPQYDYTEYRTTEDYNAGRQQPATYESAPAFYQSAPAPTQGPGLDDSETAPAPEPAPVPTVQRKAIAPIETPEGTILVGANPVLYDPAIVDPTFARQFSNTAQAIQADGGNWLVEHGFADAPRADRIAAGTVGGAVTGAGAGLVTGLVPGALITGGGAAIGGGLGVAATPILTPAIIWGGPIGYVFVPGAAALAGAGVGAAISAPIVATTTAVGAVVGGILGGAAAGGEATIIEEPAPPAPEVDALDAPAPGPAADQLPAIPAPLTADTPDFLARATTAVQDLEAAAAPALEQAAVDVAVWTEPVRDAVDGFTSVVLEQPAIADAAGPVLDQVNATLAGLIPA